MPTSTASPRRERGPSRRRRRWRLRFGLLLALVAVSGAGLAALALAARQDEDRVPRGVTVAGMDVSGLTQAEAVRRLQRRLRATERPVQVRAGGLTYTLAPRDAGVRVAYAAAVRRAIARGRRGSVLERAWRELTSRRQHVRQRARVRVARGAVRRFVARLERAVHRPAVDAALALGVERVSVTPGRAGRRLARPDALERRIAAALRRPALRHRLRAATAPIPPRVGAAAVWRRHAVVVTVGRSAGVARVFRHGRLVRRYRVTARRAPVGVHPVQAVGRGRDAEITLGGGERFAVAPRHRPHDGDVGALRLRRADLADLGRQVRPGVTVLVDG